MKIKHFLNKNKMAIAIMFFLFSMVLFLLLTMRVESDYLWHIKAGEYMFNHGILRTDVFSWSVNGKYWVSHEWLFEIMIYVFKLLFGKFHMLIYGGFCLFSLFIIMFFGNFKNYLKNIPFTLFWISLSLIFVVYIQARPHLISFCFVAITIWFLYDLYKNENSKKVYLLPIVSIFWANFHGGSSNLSYLFCLIFLIFGLFSFNFSKIEAKRLAFKQMKKYFIVMLLCIVSICINIHGFKMLIYPYLNIFDSVMVNNILEWQPTTLNNFQHYFYFGLLCIIIFIMLFSKKKILFIDFILFGVCTFLGLKSIRFWAYTYIVMSFIIFNYIDEKRYDKGSSLIVFFAGICLILFFVVNFNFVSSNLEKRTFNDELILLLKNENPSRLYNMYDYGGELIYNDILVFIDGRADLYSKYNYKDYLDISSLQGDYIKLIDKYDFDYFLVNSDYPISTYLKYNDDYKNIYNSEKIILYKKVN